MKRALSALAAAALVGLLGTTASYAEPEATGVWTPPGDTIVKITGDPANGFGIHHYDGTALYPPTDSEALAECGAYATEVARVRCRVEIRTWYRDLAATKRAINWARYDARR